MAYEHETARANEILSRLSIETDADGKTSYFLDEGDRQELNGMM
jgi:hypothetical protein